MLKMSKLDAVTSCAYSDIVSMMEQALSRFRSEAGSEFGRNAFAFKLGQLSTLLDLNKLRTYHSRDFQRYFERGVKKKVPPGSRGFCVKTAIVSKRLLRRRRHGKPSVKAYKTKSFRNTEEDLFDHRELLFADRDGSFSQSRLANLDTQLKVDQSLGKDLIMSRQCMENLGLQSQLSHDFRDPCLESISGHHTAVDGILRDIAFRLKDTSVTFKCDFYVCEAIDRVVDVMIGANFIKSHIEILFGNIGCARRSLFAPWFPKKQENGEQTKAREVVEHQENKLRDGLERQRLQWENDRSRQSQQQQASTQQSRSEITASSKSSSSKSSSSKSASSKSASSKSASSKSASSKSASSKSASSKSTSSKSPS